jgi:hypothetical protein
MAVVSDRGRIACGAVFEVLGWEPLARVAVSERAGLVVVTADSDGATRITPEGHLRVPLAIRRWCGLDAGSRVLLVADPAVPRLVVHSVAALDALVARCHDEVFGGEAT